MRIKMFISYSSKDEEFVKDIELQISRKFRDLIEPVISTQRKVIDIDLGEKIYKDIKESRWFMVLLTKNSIVNPTVIHEFGYACALRDFGLITKIIPIVERTQPKKGKMKPIDTGVFIHPSIETAKYISIKEKWGECILNITEYLQRAIEVESKPNTDFLEERAEELRMIGLHWEAAEALREAGERHGDFGNVNKAIEDFENAAKTYEKAGYIWESAQSHLKMAKLYEEIGNIGKTAFEYNTRGSVLTEAPDYNWEAANSYEKAGDLYSNETIFKKAVQSYKSALKIFKEGENDIEANKVKRKINQLGKK